MGKKTPAQQHSERLRVDANQPTRGECQTLQIRGSLCDLHKPVLDSSSCARKIFATRCSWQTRGRFLPSVLGLNWVVVVFVLPWAKVALPTVFAFLYNFETWYFVVAEENNHRFCHVRVSSLHVRDATNPTGPTQHWPLQNTSLTPSQIDLDSTNPPRLFGTSSDAHQLPQCAIMIFDKLLRQLWSARTTQFKDGDHAL